MTKTEIQYKEVISECKNLFIQKSRDYGTSWRVFGLPSLTDQIYIKAERIRNIQDKKVQKVNESVEDAFIGIINYSVMALIFLGPFKSIEEFTTEDTLSQAYDQAIELAFSTMVKKNHDYGEAWRKMRISSITDLILVKLLRLKEIEDNDGRVKVSEGPKGSYIDILNYAVFCLIRLNE